MQLPDNTQSYNRYSYCLNNPLRYTDPTGRESWYTNDPHEIAMLLNEIKNGGYNWTTGMFVNYARGRYATSSGWNYNPVATYSMGLNGRLYYTRSYGINGQLYVIGCSAGYGVSRSNSFGVDNATSANIDKSISGFMSSSFSGAGYYLKNSNATYALKNNSGYTEIKVYKNGWKGNQYVCPKSVKSLGKALSAVGTATTGIDIYLSCKEISQNDDIEVILDNSLDIAVDVIGLMPHPICKGFAIAWPLGGHWLFNQWRENVILPQIKNGTVGDMQNQPFK